VLSKFDGRAWDQFDGMRAGVQDTIEYNGETSNYVVKLDTVRNGWLFALEMPQTWDNLSGRAPIRIDSDYQLRVGGFGGSAGRVNYSVTSHSNFRAMEALDEGDVDLFRRLPTNGNPRTRALVDSFLEDSPDTDTIVARALDVFRQDGFFYTLTPLPLGEHTADEFIFDTQEGFCEHYASAFAIMLRMAGIPTRVVTGYQGGELNSMGDYYIIRQSDAHAWTEIWTPERGWYRVDPIQAVAPGRIAFGSQRISFQGERTIASQIRRMRWLRRAALAWDAANNFWDDWVIGYGPRLQRSLLEWLGFDRPRWRELLVMTVAAATVLTLALAVYLGLRTRRLNARDPAARSFEKFTRRLRQLKVEPMRDGETPSAYARRAAAALPERADPIRAITESYLQARYEPDWKGKALAGLKSRVNAFGRGYVRASR
jgi:transglutaminase-like putative cysteine protease